MKKAIASFVILALTFLAIAAVLIATGHASTTTLNRPNSLGVSESYSNTLTYLLALPVDGQVLDGRFTNIRFQPFGTPALYDQSLMFCGDVTEKFNAKTGVLVIAYETRAHGLYRGVACHDLKAVFEVAAK